ncbi:protein kinase C-like 3 [Galendromus occidentalis]|uniref:Protein kinase C-like 3 n=1 Tax=Galendromus occidentalis TaxID=34638 RepID=A0AAJ7L6A8_9ACAR|nr:protein kinase C-like 3 [Galendromus occidentalis]
MEETLEKVQRFLRPENTAKFRILHSIATEPDISSRYRRNLRRFLQFFGVVFHSSMICVNLWAIHRLYIEKVDGFGEGILLLYLQLRLLFFNGSSMLYFLSRMLRVGTMRNLENLTRDNHMGMFFSRILLIITHYGRMMGSEENEAPAEAAFVFELPQASGNQALWWQTSNLVCHYLLFDVICTWPIPRVDRAQEAPPPPAKAPEPKIYIALDVDTKLHKEIFKAVGQNAVKSPFRRTSGTLRNRTSVSTTIGMLNTVKPDNRVEEGTFLHNILSFVGLHNSSGPKTFWSFRKMRFIAELKSDPNEVVCSVRHILTGHLALVKVKKISACSEKLLKTEKKCWHRAASCLQVIPFKFYYKTDEFHVFICEHFNGCFLNELIGEGLIKPSMIAKIVSQLAFAICCLHNLGIIYRGLAPETVLVDAEGNARLIDFQFAINRSKSYSASGLLPYMAPEMCSGSHSFEVDYWSLGILMYEMIVRHHPLSIYCWKLELDPTLDSDYTMLLLKTVPIKLPKNAEANQLSFLKELLYEQPRLRIGCRRRGFADIMEHPYFAKVDWRSYFIGDNFVLSVGSETIEDSSKERRTQPHHHFHAHH